jgi:hypothetical protein
MYRVIHSLVAIPMPNFVNIGSSTRGHTSQYIQVQTNLPNHHLQRIFFSLSCSTIGIWNQLPESTISVTSLDTFKIRIQELYQHHRQWQYMGFFFLVLIVHTARASPYMHLLLIMIMRKCRSSNPSLYWKKIQISAFLPKI